MNDKTTNAPARAQKLRVSVSESNDALVIEFVASGKKLTAPLSKLPEDIQDHLLIHGLKQKLADSAAGCEPEHCEAAVTAVWETLVGGKWSQRGEGTSGPKTSQLAEALARVSKQSIEVCVAKIAKLNEQGEEGKKTLDGIKGHPQVKAALLEIRAERAKDQLAKAQAEAKSAPALKL